MARKTKRKSKAGKANKRAKSRSSKRRAATAKAKTSRSKPKSAAAKSVRRQTETIPAEPAGRIGIRRPSNQPKPPGRSEPRELAQAEPDARFGDLRQPEDNARDPAATERETGRDRGYKNTDEGF